MVGGGGAVVSTGYLVLLTSDVSLNILHIDEKSRVYMVVSF